MPDAPPTEGNPRAKVMWILWASLVFWIVIVRSRFAAGFSTGGNAGDGFGCPAGVCVFAAALLVIATVVRWIVIPRYSNPRKLLTLLVLGVALSEAVTYFGIFLVDRNHSRTEHVFFELSLLSALQFAPFFASRALSPTSS